MHDLPRRTLCDLIAKYGPDLHADVRRTEALLRDLCGAYPREIFVLIHAQKQQVAAELLNAPRWIPQTALTSRLARRLVDNLGLAEDVASWAVETWAVALNPKAKSSPPGWGWSKKPSHHSPSTSQAKKVAAQPTAHSSTWTRGLFQQVGVQSKRRLLAAVPKFDRTAENIRHWLRTFFRSPVRMAIASVACMLVVSVVSAVSYPSLLALPATLSAEPTDAPVDPLATAYPLPIKAIVGNEPLMVRAAPSTSAIAHGLLGASQAITVVEFSVNGAWSRVEWPTVGWVNNDFIRFQNPGLPTVYAVIRTEQAQVTIDGLNVRNGPGIEFAIVDQLAISQTVEIVAEVEDHSWKQIVQPIQGWVSADYLRIGE